MLATLEHRGPDDGHVVTQAGATFGARRLSILDVAGGRQPLHDDTGRFIASQNGEIYNFRELRRDLEAQGHRFSTTGDTEILAHAYREEGAGFLDRLVGMFAIAVWDTQTRRGLLARDRVGKKPLYYYEAPDGALWYASEIKALLTVPSVPRTIEPAALHHYLSYKHVPGPGSIYKGIRSVPPGHRLEVELDGEGRARARLVRYDVVRFLPSAGDPVDEQAWVERLTDALRTAVQRRLVSDVPIGFFLSGGVDSSLVTALAAQVAGTRIRTFTLTYDEESTTEGKELDRRCAREVARRYGTDHHEETLSQTQLMKELPEILLHFDEPFAGVTSTYYLSRLIAKHVKVALSGDGADELFGSYLSHRLAIPLDRWLKGERDPSKLKPFDRDLDRLKSLADPDPATWRGKLLVFTEPQKQELYSEEWKKQLRGAPSTEEHLRGYFETSPRRDPLNAILEAEFVSQLPDQVLLFVDRLSMAHSLEVRCPFLDQDFVRLAARIPGELKIRDGEVKAILKKVAEPHIPREAIYRPKEGFLMPVSQWLRGGLREYLRDTLSRKNLERHGIFDPAKVLERVDRFEKGDSSLAIPMYTLLAFQVWHDHVFRPTHSL